MHACGESAHGGAGSADVLCRLEHGWGTNCFCAALLGADADAWSA